MLARLTKTLLFVCLLGHFSYTIGGDTSTGSEAPSVESAVEGDSAAGEERYKKSCVNCHGAAGKGVASYPKISGKEISYTKSMLETYRNGIKVGPNSSLMIMMAKPLTDKEIADLAVYLKDATP